MEDRDLDDELEYHRQALEDDGADPTRLGNRTAIAETIYEMRPLYLLESITRHLRLAARAVAKNRGVFLGSAGILALGTGMSVAMFSLVNAVLIRPLPFPRQHLIEVIQKTDPAAGSHIEEMAYPELRDLQQNVPGFERVAVMPTSLYGYERILQTGNVEPVAIEGTPVSQDFFRVLGVAPALGRDFRHDDERVGAAPVVILADTVWRKYFGGDTNVIGRMARLNGVGHTVIGVMSPGVEFPRGAGLWIPLGVEKRIVERRGATFLQAIARRNPGSSRDQVVEQVRALFQRLPLDHPGAYSKTQQARVTSLVEYWTGSARVHLWIMLGASVLLLLAAIVSAGNLLLSRTLARRSEFATRVALGASRWQILTQLGCEGTAVAMFAIPIGLGIAHVVIWVITSWPPAEIPRLAETSLDPASFLFAGAAVFAAALGCTTAPGFATAGLKLEEELRNGAARLSQSQRGVRTRSIFILLQAAVTVILLATATLLVLSYRSLTSAGAGFAHPDAVTMNLQLRGPGLFASGTIDVKTRRAFYTRFLDQLRNSPGVTSAAAILLRPLEGPIGWDVPYEFEYEAGKSDEKALPKINFEVVTPGYFATVGTALLEGRDFSEFDLEDGEPVAIVSQSLARRLRANGHEPLGHRLRIGFRDSRWRRIVGVAADARYRDAGQPSDDVFVPYLQSGVATNYVVIRGSQSTELLVALARRTLNELDPTQAIARVATIGQLIESNTARHRFNMTLLLWFATCAAILAAAGVNSVIAETVAAKRREIAIRSALGARRTQLVQQITLGTVRIVFLGALLGALTVPWIGSAGSELLHDVSPRDPVVLGSAIFLLLSATSAAAFWPAWRAAGEDPKIGISAD